MNEVKRSRQFQSWRLRDALVYTGLVLGVSVCLLPDAWALQATPTTLSFQAVQGGTSPTSQIVNVLKSNNHTVTWSGTDNASWLSISPTSGSITSSAHISVSVNSAGLAAGTYTAAVTITAVQGGSISVPVTLTVTSGSTTSSTSTSTTSSTLTSTTSSTNTASLTWNASTSSNVAGYNIYMGTASGVYGPPINVGNVLTYQVTNLQSGTTYYFAVTDYDSSGNQSGFSNVVSKSIY